MLATVGFGLSGLIGVGIVLIGARFLWTPQAAAAGFGIPLDARATRGLDFWLYVKAVRDIASGLFIFILMAYGASRLLGGFMLAASIIPVGDAAIVLRSGGAKAAAYGIHGSTAIVMLAIGVLLVVA